MKQYFTLTQTFLLGNRDNMVLEEYFRGQGIPFDIGAELAGDMRSKGFKIRGDVTDGTLLKRYTVLLDEHELSAISLSVDGVQIVRNTTYIDRKNKVRGWFKWFLD